MSLVDRTSFAFTRREGIERAIALDPDFKNAGSGRSRLRELTGGVALISGP